MGVALSASHTRSLTLRHDTLQYPQRHLSASFFGTNNCATHSYMCPRAIATRPAVDQWRPSWSSLVGCARIFPNNVHFFVIGCWDLRRVYFLYSKTRKVFKCFFWGGQASGRVNPVHDCSAQRMQEYRTDIVARDT